jgi:cytosine deaminase
MAQPTGALENQWVAAVDLLVRDVRRRDDGALLDIAIRDGRIAAVGPGLEATAPRLVDGGGSLVLPGFVCAHLHLDKTLIGDELRPLRWNGERRVLREVNRRHRQRYTVESILERAEHVVEQAIAHGTTYVRGFTDVEQTAGLTGTRALVELRSRYAHEITLEVAVHPQDLLFAGDDNSRLFEQAVAAGADVVGGMPSEEPTQGLVERHIDFCLGLAKRNGLPVHMFVDDSDDPSQRGLEYLAWRTIKEGMEGRVVAGHCGALSAYDDAHAAQVVALVAEAGISICVNSHISLTLRGRHDRGPVRRGTTRVRELLDAGVNVIAAQDDVDDPYYPLGRADPLEVAQYNAHVCQLLWPAELELVCDMITGNAARAVGLVDYGLEPGCTADLVVVGRPTLRQALADIPPRLGVIARGRLVAESTVSYARHRAPVASA